MYYTYKKDPQSSIGYIKAPIVGQCAAATPAATAVVVEAARRSLDFQEKLGLFHVRTEVERPRLQVRVPVYVDVCMGVLSHSFS